ncbi:MAG: M23 family metallopeptidase [Leptolyngbya sp.]|nr:M23 family metallopeptidase [Leptolyngbya sp.]
MKWLRSYGVLLGFVAGLIVLSGLLSGETRSPVASAPTPAALTLAVNQSPSRALPARSPHAGHSWDDRANLRSRQVATQNDADTAIAFQSQGWTDTPTALPADFTLPGVLCQEVVSPGEEFAPVQTVEAGAPHSSETLTWRVPAEAMYLAPFSGVRGSPAGHEGIDYVHVDPAVPSVPVVAAAEGRVVYVRDGCPQSTLFGPNRQLRECGAGWGNHVVIDHGGGLLTRYAHLLAASIPVRVGDRVAAGAIVGIMGNTGRSDTRHLHFEVGAMAKEIDACGPSQSFDRVYDPAALGVA